MARPDALGGSRPRDLRASNADRESYSDILETAYADGRLDSIGLEWRSGKLWAATTIGELDGLVEDLLPAGSPRPRAAPVEIVAYVSGPYDSGRIVADLTGKVLDVS